MSTTKTKVLICPYCGDTQAAGERCRVCGGLFEPLSREIARAAVDGTLDSRAWTSARG